MPEIITLDSSVIVAALRKQEDHYQACKEFLEKTKDGLYVAAEPYIVLVEIAAAIRRRTGSQQLSQRVTKDLLTMDTIFFLDIDGVRAKRAAEIAQSFGLRGMDAIVVQTAEEFGATLVSLDVEMMRSVKGLVRTRAPSGK